MKCTEGGIAAEWCVWSRTCLFSLVLFLCDHNQKSMMGVGCDYFRMPAYNNFDLCYSDKTSIYTLFPLCLRCNTHIT
jgi:hypothetical protein